MSGVELDVDRARPVKVSYGMGVDSTAMLVGLHLAGVRPDVVMFADTGGEKPETYAYLAEIDAWLARVGFPAVTVVRYVPARAPYTTLEGKCRANETLPSLAFGGKSCSLVFKKEPQERWLKSWPPARACWARGDRVQVLIGYDAGPADARRSKIESDARFEYVYPLRLWGWTRDECVRRIEAAGLRVPMKSACWFCPASKPAEVVWLAEHHPDLYDRATAMEEHARSGRHGLGSTVGLGRKWAWSELEPAREMRTRGIPARRRLSVLR